MSTSEDMLQIIANAPESHLTEAELQEVETYYHAINLSDSTAILEYGSDVQKKLSELSERMLSSLHSQDMDAIGKALDTTVAYLKEIEDENRRFTFSKNKKQKSMRDKYRQAQQNVDNIMDTLQKHQIQLMKDCALLNQLNHMNSVFFRDLNVCIVAANKKLNDCKQHLLPQLQSEASASGLAHDAQEVAALTSQMEQLEKRIQALKLTQTVALQSAPLIRLVQSNQTTMAEKIQTTLLNTIPLWKNQISFALSMEHTLQLTSAQQQIHSVVKKGFFKKIKALQSVSDNTILDSNRMLMDSLTEVSRIQKQDSIHRTNAKLELTQSESA